MNQRCIHITVVFRLVPIVLDEILEGACHTVVPLAVFMVQFEVVDEFGDMD